MNNELLKWHAPCGVYCKRCWGVKKLNCTGCRDKQGKPTKDAPVCKTYKCVTNKGLTFCNECEDYPCERIQPIVNFEWFTPHNSKMYNLEMIKKLGIEGWNAICEEKHDLYYLGKKIDYHGGEGLTLEKRKKLPLKIRKFLEENLN